MHGKMEQWHFPPKKLSFFNAVKRSVLLNGAVHNSIECIGHCDFDFLQL